MAPEAGAAALAISWQASEHSSAFFSATNPDVKKRLEIVIFRDSERRLIDFIDFLEIQYSIYLSNVHSILS